jgi:4-hydroxy-3-methylbut-2-enyl diphosphate reductase IspH
MGRIPGPYLVQSEEDVAALELAPDAPLAYVTQTTLSVDVRELSLWRAAASAPSSRRCYLVFKKT